MLSLIDLIRLSGLGIDLPQGAEQCLITAITDDSRRVAPGALFVAVQGVARDGMSYAKAAVEAGAAAVLCEGDGALAVDVPVIRVPNVRLALAKLAAAFYAPQPAHIVAITGTDGKTSTAEFARQLLKARGHKAASIGTLGVKGYSGDFPAINTTPGAIALHQLLQQMEREGYQHVAMEASSHGLAQHRMDGVRVRAAAFTNITRDHLDYHKTDEAYFAAKARLFSEVMEEGGAAVLNADDARYSALQQMCVRRNIRVLDFGRNAASLRIINATPTAHGQEIALDIMGKEYRAEVELVGEFQIMNILAAIGLCIGLGEKPQDILPFIPLLRGVHGRLEKVATHASGAPVFIDYAHTPAALAKALNTLRAHAGAGRLSVVFGCGGDRDKGKRPEMGKVAAELADKVFVTDDNPRSEDPAAIRKEILAASPGAVEIGDRREAILAGIKELRAGDILLIAGKGHETTQIYKDKTVEFDDGKIAKEAVA